MVDKIEEICRTCLGGNRNMFNIFTSGSPADINLADMLMSFVSIKVIFIHMQLGSTNLLFQIISFRFIKTKIYQNLYAQSA